MSDYAKTKSCRKTRSSSRSDLQQPAGDEVYQRRRCGAARSRSPKAFSTARCSRSAEKTGEEPLKVFKRAIDNAKPTVEVKSRRVGGSTYQVPIEVHQERRGALAIRWIVSYARGRGEKTMTDRLAGEILDAANNRGNCSQEEGRYAPHGGCQQGVCALQVLRAVKSER